MRNSADAASGRSIGSRTATALRWESLFVMMCCAELLLIEGKQREKRLLVDAVPHARRIVEAVFGGAIEVDFGLAGMARWGCRTRTSSTSSAWADCVLSMVPS